MPSESHFDEENSLLWKNSKIYANLSKMVKNGNLHLKLAEKSWKIVPFFNYVRTILKLSYSKKTQKLKIFYFCSNLLQYLCQNYLLEKVAKKKQAATTIAAETATFRSCYWIEKKMNMLLQENNKMYCCKLLLIP